MLIDTENSSFM